MNSILITGSNRGLGLGIVQHLLKHKNPPTIIIATCRNLEGATELRKLAEAHKNVKILILDVKKPETFNDFAKQVGEIVGENGLNVLFNNAAIAGTFSKLETISSEYLTEIYKVNVVGSLMLTKALLPLLKRASEKNKTKPISCSRAAILNMSSSGGSITLTDRGIGYEYRCSKTALNMATKLLSIELKNDGILVTCFNPGHVQTDMGGPDAPLVVDESVSGIIDVIYKLNESHNGHFVQYDGKELPW